MCGVKVTPGETYCPKHEAQRLKIADALNYADFRELGLKRLITIHKAITMRSEYNREIEKV